MIYRALLELGQVNKIGKTPQVNPQVSPQVKLLIERFYGEMSREALQAVCELKDRKSFSARYLKPALEQGLVEMTNPDKPRSRSQRYRLTALGQLLKKDKSQ